LFTNSIALINLTK